MVHVNLGRGDDSVLKRLRVAAICLYDVDI